MAAVFTTVGGGINVKEGDSYTSANIPTGMNVVRLTKGERIYEYDSDNKYVPTPLRGVFVKVTDSALTYPSNKNDTFLWEEGEEFTFTATSTFTFYNNGFVRFGVKVV